MVGSKDYFAEDYDGKVNVNLSLRQLKFGNRRLLT
jgi:hypothetical protein